MKRLYVRFNDMSLAERKIVDVEDTYDYMKYLLIGLPFPPES